eukprot:jgi/Chrzof1/2317/Cz11g10230.t1
MPLLAFNCGRVKGNQRSLYVEAVIVFSVLLLTISVLALVQVSNGQCSKLRRIQIPDSNASSLLAKQQFSSGPQQQVKQQVKVSLHTHLSASCGFIPLSASSWNASYNGRPPYLFPKLIHQTVKNKTRISCQEKASMQTWKTLNPGYQHIIYDDADLLNFMQKFYPDLLRLFTGLKSNVERADVWRYLVLHRVGGVYADSDVQCLKPIDTWNSHAGHDAQMLVGVENSNHGQLGSLNQFVIAAMPCHPMLGAMPLVVLNNIASEHFHGIRPHRGEGRDTAIVARTGPGAFTEALHLYSTHIGVPLPPVASIDGNKGMLVGSVKILPVGMFSVGWETAEQHITCVEVAERNPDAYVCHQFFGSWKEVFYFKRPATYDNC